MSVAKKGKLKPLDGSKFLCPLSYVEIQGRRIKPHYLESYWCKEGQAVYIVCGLHWVRAFINDQKIVRFLHGEERATV